jgi:hypothetical protein
MTTHSISPWRHLPTFPFPCKDNISCPTNKREISAGKEKKKKVQLICFLVCGISFEKERNKQSKTEISIYQRTWESRKKIKIKPYEGEKK